MEWKLLEDDSEKKQQKGKRNQQASTSQNASETEITGKLKCLKKIWNDFKRVLCVKKCYKYVNEQPEVHLDTISTNNDKLTIVFDLDSTLVFSTREKRFEEQCFMERIKYYVAIRPYCRTLLETIRPFCNIVVYSAGGRKYVHHIVELLDGEKKFFDKVLSRDNCQLENGFYIKDLRKTEYPLERTVWIDDKVKSFPFQFIKYSHNIYEIYVDKEKRMYFLHYRCDTGAECMHGFCCSKVHAPPAKQGRCPILLVNLRTRSTVQPEDQCFSDVHCESILKCCLTFAGKRCLLPETDFGQCADGSPAESVCNIDEQSRKKSQSCVHDTESLCPRSGIFTQADSICLQMFNGH
ncbi:CTD small phosphatase-like protein 2-A [Trichinella pseudospiralis]|uniref:Mitochondrial import inner membrane translocase subunit TIM50 n=1 Tax=Trichinella pseudospiralis TaxID=6337 RepID=A0A0V1DTF1_TRIPS|nr:CTD small phosphatase-like protein 2-A [Trichinella pseudospiralis]